ncbi:hypothetical protein TRIUR3_31567 [Triticum urartu]|uniref:Uncharacterized protein n=1 Tax=Triticum urartu TaxID=4572 RepID=M7Z994_TRIUA|nr:hypothetical protein TRIUR3_31567 [Triticum urartu]
MAPILLDLGVPGDRATLERSRLVVNGGANIQALGSTEPNRFCSIRAWTLIVLGYGSVFSKKSRSLDPDNDAGISRSPIRHRLSASNVPAASLLKATIHT